MDPAGWAAGTPEPLLKIPAAVPLDLLIFELLVLLCAILVFLSAGLVRAPLASSGHFLRIVQNIQLGSSLSFSSAGRSVCKI